ncbi:MAG: PTS sugar transporter subunit IIA [Pirellulaceae bacterium]
MGGTSMHEDFDVESLATYLHLTPAQVVRLASREKLPGRKIGGQWRFSQAEIHHWLEKKIGVSDESELVQVEGVLERAENLAGAEVVLIAEWLTPEAIAVPLAARTRNSVITSMVQLAARTGMLWDEGKMADAVRAREELHPTALDNGVALLHPRRPMSSIVAEPVIALGRTYQGIPFGGRGGQLTDVFFLLCSLTDRDHLRALARLSRMIADAAFLTALRELETPAQVHDFIADAETTLDD